MSDQPIRSPTLGKLLSEQEPVHALDAAASRDLQHAALQGQEAASLAIDHNPILGR